MTTIKYRINNQTSRTIIASDFNSAQIMRQQIIEEELPQLGWYVIIAEITNNDGSITMCPIDAQGIPQTSDEEGNTIPYVDTTVTQ